VEKLIEKALAGVYVLATERRGNEAGRYCGGSLAGAWLDTGEGRRQVWEKDDGTEEEQSAEVKEPGEGATIKERGARKSQVGAISTQQMAVIPGLRGAGLW
jgi:hypothetical protein